MNSALYKILFIIKDNLVNILRSFISSFGILFLVIFFVLYLTVRDSVTNYISGSLLDKLASDEIKILPGNAKAVEYVKKPGSSGISPDTVTRIKRMPELSEVNPISRIGLNLRVKAEMLGKSKMMFVPACGIDRQIIKGKVSGWKSFYNRKPVPVIIPRFTIDIINNYLAMDGLPSLSEKDLTGFPVELKFRTGKRGSADRKEYIFDAQLHSFTDLLSFPGVILPNELLVEVAEKHRRETGRSAGFEYIVAYAKVKNTDILPQTVSKLKKMGLNVESQKDISEKARKTIRLIDGVFYAIMGAFFIVSAISIFNSYLTIVYIRSQKFSLKRVLGFSKLRILLTFVFEAAFIGSVYGAAGYCAGNHLVSCAGEILSKWVPALGYITFQGRGYDVLLMCVGLSSAVCAASAFIPAVFASNMNLFRAVRK